MLKRFIIFAVFSLFVCHIAGAKEIFINEAAEQGLFNRRSKSWEIPPLSGKGRVVFAFECRLKFDRLGGWNPCWQLMVNGKKAAPMATRSISRVLNKPLQLQHIDFGPHNLIRGGRFFALFSPDFESAKSRFKPKCEEAYRFVIDITDLLFKDGKNNITLRFGSELDDFYISQKQGFPPEFRFRNLQIRQDDTASEIPVSAKREDNLFRFRDIKPAEYQLRNSDGALEIAWNDHTHFITSKFSVPGGKWAKLEGHFLKTPVYEVSRKIIKRTGRIDIFDTFKNTSDELIGIRLRYDMPEKEFPQIYLGGDPDPWKKSSTGGENPTVFFSAPDKDYALGIIAQDDVFQVQNYKYVQKNRAGFGSDHFALSPGETRTVEWSIYLMDSSNYFDFVNAVRKDWNSNFRIDGGFHLSLAITLNTWNRESFRKFHTNAGLMTGYNSFGPPVWRSMGGKWRNLQTVLQGPGMFDEKLRAIDASGKRVIAGTAEYRDFVKKTLRAAKFYAPELKRLMYVHNQWSVAVDEEEAKYADCKLTDKNGKQLSLSLYRFYVPTENNYFGKKNFDYLVKLFENFDLDGIYHDEFSHTASRITYSMWDGVSVELDDQHRVKCKIGYVPLLKLGLSLKVMDYVINQKGKAFVANGSPSCRSARKFKFPRFEETYSQDAIYNSHLYTPIQLGDQCVFATTPEDNAADIRNAIRNGALYYHYNNQAACPTITANMYPFTPVAIYAGTLIGEERILSIQSGEFFRPGDDSLAVLHLFNERGAAVQDENGKFFSDGKNMVFSIKLKKDHCFSLEKIPVRAVMSPGVELRNVSWQNGVLKADISGNGKALFTFADGVSKEISVNGKNQRIEIVDAK